MFNKPIVISEKNREKIAAILDDVQKRSKERTITVDTIFAYPQKIVKELGIAKCHLEGSTFCVDPNAQDYPKAYSYTPKSTQFMLVFSNGTWKVKWIDRLSSRMNGYGKKVESRLSDSAKAAIVERFYFMHI